ncbi:MAG: MFS transporter [Microbacteriaceae bacterium]|nr:MFS transporter [Microbacteriaceae bacterium]
MPAAKVPAAGTPAPEPVPGRSTSGRSTSGSSTPGPSAPSRSTLSRSTLVRYATGSIGTGGFGTLPGLVLLIFLTDTLGVAAFWAGVVITAAKVWDVVIDPVIGARSDHSLAATGSRRRFMLIGALALPVFFVLTFAVPAGIGPVAAGLWVLVAFVLTATAFSLFQVPYIALPAELVDDYDARTRLLSARVVVLAFAILLFGAGGPEIRDAFPADPRLGYLVLAIVAGLVIGGGMLVAVFSAPTGVRGAGIASTSIAENYRLGFAALKRSRAFRALLGTFVLQGLATGMMLAGASYVAKWVLDTGVALLFVALIAPALLCAPLWSAVSARIGKERAFVIASALFGVAALSLLGLIWAPGEWLYAPVALAGAAYAGMQSLPMAMLPDVISHDAREHGEGRAGTFGGAWTAGETAGMALGTTLLALVLAVSGYIESVAGQEVAQAPSAITGIVLSFSVVPAVLMGISLLTFARYPLRKGDIDGSGARSGDTGAGVGA